MAYFDWVLRGNAKASEYFKNDAEAKNAGWKVESKNLDGIKVTPL